MNEKKLSIINMEDIDAREVPQLIQEQFSLLRENRKKIDEAMSAAQDIKQTVVDQVGSNNRSIATVSSAAIRLAKSQENIIEAQSISFKYQQKLAETTQFLFCLGLTNISMNRVVVEQLEMKLRDASQGELDDLAKEEVTKLLKRLKVQQDLDKKQQDLEVLLKEQHEAIVRLTEKLDLQEKQIRDLQARLA